ncbi:unnamed protein product, partial [Choristocarpus tenellus]
QVTSYSEPLARAPHTAEGAGLSAAITGVQTNFTIHLRSPNGDTISTRGPWNVEIDRFIYVWLSGSAEVSTAIVTSNSDGTLTAMYSVAFPGRYDIHIEDVDLANKAVYPIIDSPFKLTVTGQPKLDPDALPLCSDDQIDLQASFWR